MKLAWKNLTHDRIRLAVTLTGIVFALVLIVVQFGLFLGFLDTSANVVAHSNVDLWIASKGLPHVNGGSPLPERYRYRALAVPGVVAAEKYTLFFVPWKLPSGAQESVQIVGFNPQTDLGGPWNLTAGSIADLRGEDTVIVDEVYRQKLGVTHLGQTVEIFGRRARIVGFTQGIRSFTTSPYVFTSFKNSQNYIGLPVDQTIFHVVRIAPGYAPADVKATLQRALPDAEVLTNDEMTNRTAFYWLFTTGAGITTLMGAALGLLVGVVVVAQTIYAATMDHLREFGTLKAMGATNAYLYKVILGQAVMSGVAGYFIAIVISYFVVRSSASGEAPILLPPPVAAGVLALAVVMCVTASVVSIRKATTIDPAMVFRG